MYILHKIICILQRIRLLTMITKFLDTLYVHLLKRCCLRFVEVQSAQLSSTSSIADYRLEILAEKETDIQLDIAFYSAK